MANTCEYYKWNSEINNNGGCAINPWATHNQADPKDHQDGSRYSIHGEGPGLPLCYKVMQWKSALKVHSHQVQ